MKRPWSYVSTALTPTFSSTHSLEASSPKNCISQIPWDLASGSFPPVGRPWLGFREAGGTEKPEYLSLSLGALRSACSKASSSRGPVPPRKSHSSGLGVLIKPQPSLASPALGVGNRSQSLLIPGLPPHTLFTFHQYLCTLQ